MILYEREHETTGLPKENEAGQRAISWLLSQVHVVETVKSRGAVTPFRAVTPHVSGRIAVITSRGCSPPLT